ncbi:MAG: hypothetical protein JW704_05040 [Anaerolineaceae bacterium]|nr:hypothetical protein [Anaerolineaceae bacterium]
MSTIIPQFQKQLRKRPLEALILIFAVAYIIVDLVLLNKNPKFIINTNIILNPVVAIITALIALVLVGKMGPGNPKRTLWVGLAAGWSLWAVAELLYALPLFIGKEATYPSAADVFFILGYIPIIYTFLQRQRTVPVDLSRNKQISALVIFLLVIGFTGYFILMPIIRVFNPDEAVISILNLVYPLLDLGLLLLVLRRFFAFGQGSYGLAQMWVAIGFIVKTFSDLAYYYLIGIDRYYHYGLVHFNSVFLVDFTHTASYLLFLIGLTILWRVPLIASPVSKNQAVVEQQ